MRRLIWNLVSRTRAARRANSPRVLLWLRALAWPLAGGTLVECFGWKVRITDGPNFYMQYKDEFLRRVYHFQARRPDPLIIDGGSNMGMSMLYFKHAYPRARIIGFEPDPAVFAQLRENVERNGLKDIRLINAGLDGQRGSAAFLADHTSGGRVVPGAGGANVRVEVLSDYLDQEVDFLKLNIEGLELPVLREAAASGKLRNVRELVLEYHGWAAGPQSLGPILELLAQQGYRYLVHDFDAETCPASKPPFHALPPSTWFCLVHAARVDPEPDPHRAEPVTAASS